VFLNVKLLANWNTIISLHSSSIKCTGINITKGSRGAFNYHLVFMMRKIFIRLSSIYNEKWFNKSCLRVHCKILKFTCFTTISNFKIHVVQIRSFWSINTLEIDQLNSLPCQKSLGARRPDTRLHNRRTSNPCLIPEKSFCF